MGWCIGLGALILLSGLLGAACVRAALLAPTAMNQQKFTFTLQGGSVAAKAGTGFYTKVDLGIAKYHFEIGAGTAQFRWAP